jgi:hypothetical protein
MIASLLEVTADTVRAICALQTTEEQKRFVAPNALSIFYLSFGFEDTGEVASNGDQVMVLRL